MAKKILFALTLVGGGITIIALILVVNYYVLFWTEPTTSPPGGFTPHPAGKWLDGVNAGDIYYSGGNVGIGTNDPQKKLEISNGTIGLQFRPGEIWDGTSFVPDNDAVTLEMPGIKKLDIADNLIVNAGGKIYVDCPKTIRNAFRAFRL